MALHSLFLPSTILCWQWFYCSGSAHWLRPVLCLSVHQCASILEIKLTPPQLTSNLDWMIWEYIGTWKFRSAPLRIGLSCYISNHRSIIHPSIDPSIYTSTQPYMHTYIHTEGLKQLCSNILCTNAESVLELWGDAPCLPVAVHLHHLTDLVLTEQLFPVLTSGLSAW